MTVAPLACAMLLTSSSGSGSDQATRRATPSSPLRAVLASAGVRRTCASAFESVRAMVARWLSSAARVREHLEALVGERAGRRPPGMHGARDRAGHDATQPAPAARRRGGRRDARVRVRVGERQQHARERDPVGDAVVHARVQGAALAVAVDQVEVPERLRAVERLGHQVADQLLERGAVARAPAARGGAGAARGRSAGRPPRRRRRAGRRSRPRAGGSAGSGSTSRSPITSLTRGQSIGSSKSRTALMTIRFVGRSIRSHAASALGILSRRAVMESSPPAAVWLTSCPAQAFPTPVNLRDAPASEPAPRRARPRVAAAAVPRRAPPARSRR